MSTTVAVLATFSLSAGVLQKQADEGMNRLGGAWGLLSTADERHTDAGSPDIRMEVGGRGHVVFKLKQLDVNQGEIRLGCAGKCKTIDLTLSDGRVLLGVYELKDDQLTICFDEAGKPRPAGIAPTGTQWAEKWKRER